MILNLTFLHIVIRKEDVGEWRMKFTKMHGTGNDFICIDGLQERIDEPGELAKYLCDRHFGVGADGMLVVLPSDKADCRMELYNADGSRARMCGNGLRCLGKYVYEHGMIQKTSLVVATLSGLHEMKLELCGEQVRSVCVDMGNPRLNAHSIPILCEKEIVLHEPLWLRDQVYYITGVSMGNPHAVIFTDCVDTFPVGEAGRNLEFHPRFPERINIEFCQVMDRKHMKIRVWERGVGETLACGTGACAAVVAAVLNDYTDRSVSVELRGGTLEIEWKYAVNRVYMRGEVSSVFEGNIDIPYGACVNENKNSEGEKNVYDK